MPQPESNALDLYSQAFVDFAPESPGPYLDVGAAYGIASLAALRNGATIVANDIDARHLEILRDRAPETLRSRLTLLPRVMHFFDGPTIEKLATFARPEFPPDIQLDGRESIGLIARKQ